MGKIKRIKVFQLAKFQAILLTLIGLICGVLYSFGGLIIDTLVSAGILSSTTMSTPGLSYGTILAFGALVGMPLIFGVSGFILGLFEAVLYNLTAKWFGGFKIALANE